MPRYSVGLEVRWTLFLYNRYRCKMYDQRTSKLHMLSLTFAGGRYETYHYYVIRRLEYIRASSRKKHQRIFVNLRFISAFVVCLDGMMVYLLRISDIGGF